MPEFTDAQKRAINESGRTLLISAAAGSGKTTTLTERIIRSICRAEDPTPLDRLLVVTFTKESAADLRARISRALEAELAKDGANAFLAHQITLLPSAKIGTIDSFLLNLVKQNYAALGLSPSFRMADEAENAAIAAAQMEALLDDCYDNPSSTLCGGPEGFASLVGLLCGIKSDGQLSEILLSLYEKLDAYPRGAAALFDREAELREYAKDDFFACPLGGRVEREVCDLFLCYKEQYEYALEVIRADEKLAVAYEPMFNEDYIGILKVLSALETGYAAAYDEVQSIAFSRLGSYRPKGDPHPQIDFVKTMRNDFKKAAAACRDNYFSTDADALRVCLVQTADAAHGIGELLCEYERRARAEKRRRGVCSFSDVTRYALRLLTTEEGGDSPLAVEQKSAYDAVYIDEYQDVNAVQDRIFRAVSKPDNLFMVGDIKQSIYGFRGAEPTIFAELRNKYPLIDEAKDGESATIFMSENFRCSKEVVDFTNLLFDRLMPAISPETGYAAQDALVYSKRGDSFAVPVKIVLCETPPKDAPSPERNTEAEYIADEIDRLVRFEKKQDGSRIRYGDIAILLRSMKGFAAECADVLRTRGIPVAANASANLLDAPEVQIFLDLLGAVDNPRRDVSLAGVLLSPLCGVSTDLLAKLRKGAGAKRLYTTVREYLAEDGEASTDREKLAAFSDLLAGFRSMARCMSASDLIEEMRDTLAFDARVCGADALRRANIDLLCEAARGAAAQGYGSLSDFLRYIRSVENDVKNPLAAAKPETDSADAVRFMTVHGSKGLEYPVVFLCNTAKAYNMRDADATPIYSAAGGFGLQLRDATGFCRYDNLVRKSVALCVRDKGCEEELRLLYVALTRARERLYMTASVSKPEKEIADAETESRFGSPYLPRMKRSYLSLALFASRGAYPFVETRVRHFDEVGGGAQTETEAETEAETEPLDTDALRALDERLAWRYPHAARTKIPAKFAVSLLYPDILDDALSPFPADAERLPPMKDAPRFALEKDADGARRGTATHLFMQFFDFTYAAENGAAAELRRLVENRFITPEDAALVNLAEVECFLRSPLFAEMRAAKKLYREQRFNLRLPAADFAEDAALREELADEQILVQGVIDCFWYGEDDEITLIDYKTDRLYGTREEKEQKLRDAHSRQLSYYVKAIEQLCGKPPARVLLYALALGDAVEL